MSTETTDAPVSAESKGVETARRTYRSGESRSLPYGKRMVRGPQRDWQGKSDFKRRSLPEKPHFIKVEGRAWDDWRNVFDPVQFRQLFRRRRLGIFQRPGFAALNERAGYLKQYGLRWKLKNAAQSTRIRHDVANRRAALTSQASGEGA